MKCEVYLCNLYCPYRTNNPTVFLLFCSGNPARYQSRGVVRMNRNDSKPFEDQRLGVPGTGTESEADQHLRGMVKNQLDTNVTLERYNILKL